MSADAAKPSFDFGHVRSLLQQPESEALWYELVVLLKAWPDRQQLEHEIMPYAVDILSRWRHTRRPLHRGKGPFGWSFVEQQGWVSVQSDDPILFLLGDTIDLGRDFYDYWDDYAHWQEHHYDRLHISPAHQSALFGSPYMVTIKHLILRDVFLGEPGVKLLTQSPYMSGLETLALDSSYLGEEGVRAFNIRGALTALTSLELSGCVLGAQGFMALAELPWLKLLRHLSVSLDKISDEALFKLLKGAYGGAVTTLELKQVALDDQGLLTLRDHGGHSSLTTLDLSSNPLSANACAAFIVGHRFERLERLVLSCDEETLRESLGEKKIPAWVELVM